MSYNLFSQGDVDKLKSVESKRFVNEIKGPARNASTSVAGGGRYLDLQGLELSNIEGIDIDKLKEAARIMRGFIFAMLEKSKSGHPGGSSGKVEQFLAMILGGAFTFDALDPKNTGRDRVVWSAGHCSPGLYSGLALMYESLKKAGKDFDPAKLRTVMAQDLLKFRKHDGPQGHIENYYPLSDIATGPSGHGMPAAGALAITHKSCGLDTNIWVFMGDAESEEGMTYEARNLLNTVGADNMIVAFDYNHNGIDGVIEEVISSPMLNHWQGMGWNVIEVDGHNLLELVYAYRLAEKKIFKNGSPTVVIAHTIKGKDYGAVEGSCKSHGAPAKHEDYVPIMKNIGFDIAGVEGEVEADLGVVLESLTPELASYVTERLEESRSKIKDQDYLIDKMKGALQGRKMVNPMTIKRPEILPAELVFEQGEKMATRKASQAFFNWLMNETAFFWSGAGDLAGSVLTSKCEDVYGIINRENPYGRGIRYGIAEQNMAMMGAAMTADRLPGGFAPVSVFSSYAVFSSMMTSAIRLILIGNHLYPEMKGFFILLAAHDGPETGEDGPTHQGLYWMSMYNAYPGIKVYKPMDANETIEMLFYAIEKGEPIALSITRPDTPVFKRGEDAYFGQFVPEAREAVNGAYIFKDYKNNGNKKLPLVISGMQVLQNTIDIVPDLEAQGYDVKLIAVTSPELYEDLKKENPTKANIIFTDEDRSLAITLHAGWKGFLYPFLLPSDYEKRTIAIETYLKSGSVDEVYELAHLAPSDIKERVLNIVNSRYSP